MWQHVADALSAVFEYPVPLGMIVACLAGGYIGTLLRRRFGPESGWYGVMLAILVILGFAIYQVIHQSM